MEKLRRRVVLAWLIVALSMTTSLQAQGTPVATPSFIVGASLDTPISTPSPLTSVRVTTQTTVVPAPSSSIQRVPPTFIPPPVRPSPECSNYRFFNESNRARTYNKPVPVLCDTSLTGWYRFSGAAGSRMAETCVPYKHCATSAPGWLDGGHPTVFEGAVKRKVCFSGRTKCCSWTINISVRNCGDFYVYELKKPPHCNFRYCGNGISSTPAPTSPWRSTTTTPPAFTPANPACPKERILKETSGVISVNDRSLNQTCSWKIIASKGKRVKLVIKNLYSQWCKDCSCRYLGIQNGSFADGAPSERLCGDILRNVTFYSNFETLKVMLVTRNLSYVQFVATYTQINYNYSVSTGCSNYKFLNEANRAVTYLNHSIGYLCDSKLSGWYRFSGDAGSQMAESCPRMYHCSTDSPGWLSGNHPTVADGVVQRKVCFHSSSLFDRQCCLHSRYISVRNCGTFYVYKLDPTRCYLRYCGNALPQAPECFNYRFLNDSNRAETYKNSTAWCADSALSGWYRFGGEAGSQMAIKCVQENRCGTSYSGWLSGGHPTMADGTVVRKVCFNVRRRCCQVSIYISVRNCGGFYVYKLTSLPCNLRYCAGNGSEPTTAFTTDEPSTPITVTTIEPTTSPTSPWRSSTTTSPTFTPVNPACPKERILKETSGDISGSHYSSGNHTCSWKIIAIKGRRVKLVIKYLQSSWCKDCSCSYLEIQNGSFADGAPSEKMCGSITANVTFYSNFETLKVMLVTGKEPQQYVDFLATYTQINYNYGVSFECSNYRFLNEANRAVTYLNRSIGYLCDSKLSGWYRFNGDAGSQMAESCPSMYHCSTDSPGWLSGNHPTVADGVVQRKVCFHSSLFPRHCCLNSSYISVRNCGAFYVYKLDPTRCYLRYCGNALPQAPECFNYRFLNDSNRAESYKNNIYLCADVLLSGWYRFGGEAGSQMANKCVQENHCGIRHPGWLSGGHPTMADGTVVRKVCFNYFRGCCQGSIYISVRNCGGFYVYNLKSLSCYFRYCASNGSEPTTAFTTEEPSTPTTATTIEPTTS